MDRLSPPLFQTLPLVLSLVFVRNTVAISQLGIERQICLTANDVGTEIKYSAVAFLTACIT